MSSPPVRFDEAAQPVQYLPCDGALVRCPRCDGPALARSARVICSHCGYVRDSDRACSGPVRILAAGRCGRCGRRLSHQTSRAHGGGPPRTWPVRCPCGGTAHLPLTVYAAGGDGIDPRSGLPLWLAMPFRGHVLWAINADHLTFLENYVAAGLRETAAGNSGLASLLPAWITAAKNRDDILRALARLRGRLDDRRSRGRVIS